jgi:putative FmdB family regulatory protein
MPTYEYICESCKHKFEKFQTIRAKSLRTCPKCGKKKLKRLIGTGAGIIFKGSGFYQTDYRSESYKKAVESEKKSPDDKKKETKTTEKDSKTEAKQDSKTKSNAKDQKKSA